MDEWPPIECPRCKAPIAVNETMIRAFCLKCKTTWRVESIIERFDDGHFCMIWLEPQ